MKKLILLILLLFVTSFSYSQNRIVFTIDNPLTSIQKPKYEFKDYEIPFKSIGIITGIYSGLEMIFSEDESGTEFYNFYIMLPSNNVFYLNKLGDESYTISNGIFPIEFSDKDFSEGVYVERIGQYIYPIVVLKKYSRDVNNALECVDNIRFENFSIDFTYFKCHNNNVSLRAELKGSVNFSSKEYDAPYYITATIEINDKNLYTIFAD